MPDIDPVTTFTDAMNSYSNAVSEFMVDHTTLPQGEPATDAYGNPVHQPRDPMPPNAHQAFTAAAQALHNAAMHANGAATRAQGIRENLMVPEEGRRQQLDQDAEQRHAQVRDHIRTADNALTVLEATLEAAALGQVSFGAEQTARADAMMILDRADDPSRVMEQLATRGDDIGALVTSSWGRDYLLARGITDPEFHRFVRLRGVEAAEQSTDPVRAGAARYRRRLPKLQGARDTVMQNAQALLAEVYGR